MNECGMWDGCEMDGSSVLDRLRSVRVYDTAVFDWVGSAAIGVAVGAWLRLRGARAWIAWTIWWVLLGAFAHVAVGVRTPVSRALGM